MRIVIGSDHAGFELKGTIVSYIQDLGHQIIDVGTNNAEPVDYPEYAEAVGKAILEERADRGIMICGSGVGASIAVNKLPGIRAGLCHDTYSAHQGVEHDNINVLIMGARVIGIETARELVRAYIGAEFTEDERHLRRLDKLSKLEEKYRGKYRK